MEKINTEKRLSSYSEALSVEDIQEIMKCGYSKARLIMDKVEHFRSGKKDLCWKVKFLEYIDNNGGFVVKWPKK